MQTDFLLMIHKLFFAFAFVLSLCLTACRDTPPNRLHHNPNYTHVYSCPMNCEENKTYEQPGKCPVCHMKLKEKEVPVKDVNQKGDSSTIHITPPK